MLIEHPSGDIDYDERGQGHTLVFVPGSCSTGAAWRPVIAALGSGYRCVTTSLPGYGGTAERRSADDVSIDRIAEAIEEVICLTSEHVHLVGHSFGGLVAVAVALRGKVGLASLSILEAPAFMLLGHAPDDGSHARAFQTMTDSYFATFSSGDRTAIAQMIDFYGGAGTFASWPERVRAYAIDTTAVNIRDWQSAFGFPLTAGMLATLDLPTLVAWGGNSHPATQRANVLLSEAIAASDANIIAGAAHFMIATHASEVAALISRHVRSAIGKDGSDGAPEPDQ